MRSRLRTNFIAMNGDFGSEGVRDRALLFFAFASSGCRRSEVAATTKDTLGQLIELKEVDTFSPEGKRRLEATTLTDADRPSSQQSKLFTGG